MISELISQNQTINNLLLSKMALTALKSVVRILSLWKNLSKTKIKAKPIIKSRLNRNLTRANNIKIRISQLNLTKKSIKRRKRRAKRHQPQKTQKERKKRKKRYLRSNLDKKKGQSLPLKPQSANPVLSTRLLGTNSKQKKPKLRTPYSVKVQFPRLITRVPKERPRRIPRS